jgi:hypothetical protein
MFDTQIVQRRFNWRTLLAPIAAAALVASCGSDGDATVVESSLVESSVVETTTSTPDDDSDQQPSAGSAVCSEVFSDAEIEAFFAEPAELTEDNNQDIGVLSCTWDTIENGDEDLTLQALYVQFFFGPNMDASTVFNPTLFEPIATIDDVGDEAFVSNPSGLAKSYHFIEGDVAGSLMYLEVNFDNDDVLHSDDDVEQLFRTFHARIVE